MMHNRDVTIFKSKKSIHILIENHFEGWKKKDLQAMNKLPFQGVQLPLKPEKKKGISTI